MNEQAEPGQQLVKLAYISAVHGLRGWVKIYSYTEPKESVLNYQPWILDGNKGAVKVLASKLQSKGVIARLQGIETVEQARELIGTTISVPRSQFEDLPENEFYWEDLIGLKVVNLEGAVLGEVKSLMATGANDVLVVAGEQERVVPFVMEQFIKTVDIPGGTITVDWDPEF
jgi:16S rRNA processing protein RimM